MRRLVSPSVLGVVLAVAVLSGCQKDPMSADFWADRLADGKTKKEKLRALEDLRESKALGPTTYPVLLQRLAAEKNDEVKGRIAKILGLEKVKEAVQPLCEAVDLQASDSESRGMNKEIASALGELGDPAAVPTLIKLLGTKDNFTVLAALDALGGMKSDEAFDAVHKVATDESIEKFITKKAIVALGNIGDAKAVPALVKHMFKERQGVSFYMESSFALYQIGTPAADALLPVLEKSDKAFMQWAEANKIKPEVLPLKAAQVLGDLHDNRAEKRLIALLNEKTDFDDIRGLNLMKAADALGRMRSTAGARDVAAALVTIEEPAVRRELVWSLRRIGGRDALPKLLESAGKGIFEAREQSIRGVAALGDERELPALDKLIAAEPKATEKECKDYPDLPECADQKATLARRLEKLNRFKKTLEAAGQAKDAQAWAAKLDDAEEAIRERAAYEVGRSGTPGLMGELLKRLPEKNLDVRLAIIQGIDWLASDSPEAMKAAQAHLPELRKQLAEEKGKTEFVKVNEDLRRLEALLVRG